MEGKFPLLYRYKTKLIVAFGLLILITLTSVGVIHYSNVREQLERSSKDNMERELEQMVTNFELRMGEITKLAVRLSAESEFQIFSSNLPFSPPEMLTTYQQRMDFETRNSGVYSVIVYDKDDIRNQVALYQATSKEADALRWKRLGLETAFSARANKWDLEGFTHRNGRTIPVLLYSQPIYRIKTYEVNPVAVLQISMGLDWMLTQLKDSTRQRMEYVITDAAGNILLSPNPEQVGGRLSSSESFGHRLQGESGFWQTGDKQIGMRKFQQQEWYLMGIASRSEIRSAAGKAVEESIMLGAVIFALGMTIAVTISHSVTQPIHLLRTAMRQLERGALDTTVEMTNKDEFGYLGKSFNHMAKQIKSLVEDNLQIELSRREAELIALQTQINPHFLYNALSSIDSLAAGLEDARIRSISHGLADMFRYSVSGNVMTNVQKELEYVELYLSIQKIRYERKLDYFIEMEAGLEPYELPKLLLQPIVENAVAHGIEMKAAGGYVRISVYSVSDAAMSIEIEDDGVGIEPERLEQLQRMFASDRFDSAQSSPRRPIGLMNVYRRIALLYEREGAMEITSSAGFGTVVKLTVPKRGGMPHDVQSRDR